MSTSFKLDTDLKKALLQEIEASKVLRSEFDLNALVNRKSFIYGEVGSDKRRAVQKQFSEFKRKTAHQYLKLLGKFGISPGEGLKRELLGDGNEEYQKDSDEEDEAPTTTSDNGSGYESDSDYSSSTSTKATPRKTTTPVEDIEFASKSHHKRMSTDTDTSTTEGSSLSSASISSTVISRVEMLEKPDNKQDGSKENPYIIIADPEKPETCHGFEVALVPQVKVGNFVRSVYHIRHVTTQGMEDEWSAIIPREEFPALANRSVLIRGPSQELWHRRTDLYHEEPFCAQTALVHEAQQTAVKKSIVRLYSYWLLVLPKATMLENYIISHDSVHVVKGTREMEVAFEIEDDNGKAAWETLYGMDVYWRIAEAGGNMVHDPESATKKRRKKKKTIKT